jgi:tetratricopeptide (TPR) repeat protein
VVDLVYDEVRHGTFACKRWESVSAETRFRLKQQYRRTLTINHPNLVRLFELFAEGDATCLTMEAISGAEVRSHVRALGDESPINAVLDVLHQLSDALMTLHAAGIVHRDVKPSNVLVEAGGRVVLLDGSFVWPRESHFQPLDEHMLAGTLAYLAPECLRGALPSVESDWYGFGALAAELLTARPPFAGSLDALLRAKDAEPRSVRLARSDVPPALDDLVCGLLERDPRMRPTGMQLFQELHELRKAHPSTNPPAQAAQSLTPLTADDGRTDAGETSQHDVVIETAHIDAIETAQHDAIDAAHIDTVDATHLDAVETAHTNTVETAPVDLIETAQTESVETGLPEAIETAQDDSLETINAYAIEIPTVASPESASLTAADATSADAAPREPSPPVETAPAAPFDLAPADAARAPFTASELIDLTTTTSYAAVETLPLDPVETPQVFHEGLAPRELEQALAPLDLLPVAPSGNSQAEPAPLQAGELEPGVLGTQLATEAPAVRPPSAAPSASLDHDAQLAGLETLLTGPALTQLVLILGRSGADKTRLAADVADRTRQRAGCMVFDARCSATPDQPFNGFDAIMSQLDEQLGAVTAERRGALITLLENPSLVRMFPRLSAHSAPASAAEEALDPQRRFIDALLAFRRLWLLLAEDKRVLICLDDCQFLDRDAMRLLQVLLFGESSPKLTVVLACSQPAAPDWLMARLERMLQDTALCSTRVDLKHAEELPSPAPRQPDLLDESAATSGNVQDPTAAQADAASELQAARHASDALALELAADLYRRTLERHPENARQWLADAAQAEQSAGRLEDAARSWLALARSSPDRCQAQRCELAAAAALLHSGHEQEGRALLESVLRDCGVRWPRLPWLTSTIERARVLLGPLLSAPIVGPRSEQAGRRFDALWAAAKEVVLLTPTAGDALSVHALREAGQLGDPSRLSWALGYEAALEANIGGPYMQRRARALEAQVTLLAEQSGQTFDAAYARSVQGVVAWFGGQWATAEFALRDALRLYDRSPTASAHERHVLESFLVGALEAQGKQNELAALLVELQIAAEQTGHVHALAMCRLAEASLPALVRDQPLAAIASADAALGGFANDDFTPLRFQHCVVTVSARLYAGHASQAFQQIEQLWRRPGRTYFLRLDAVGVMLRQLRARAALAMTQHSTTVDAERLRKIAVKEAAAIGSTGSAHARGLEHVIRSSLASLAGSRELARQHCAQAIEAFDTADMALMCEVARHQHAMLTNDLALRARELAQSGAFFRRTGVRNPAALTRAWFPVPAS